MQTKSKLKIAIVTPWISEDVIGGAERHSLNIAEHLANAGNEVTFLTTRSKSFRTSWEYPFYSKGECKVSGIRTLRFNVDARDFIKFNKANKAILAFAENTPIISSEIENDYLNENINSSDLKKYLILNYDNYNAFIFIPYLFGTTLNLIECVKEKSFIIPCLHDETYASLNVVKKALSMVRWIFLNSDGEKEILAKRFPEFLLKSSVTHGGIEINPRDFEVKDKPLIDGDYLLYIGRKDEGKNVFLLQQKFQEYIKFSNSNLKLVYAGLGEKISGQNIIDLGKVSEKDKINLLKNAKFLINPSEHESFSRVIYESWMAKVPIIVNENCYATSLALKESNYSGLVFKSDNDLAEIIAISDKMAKDEVTILGKRGFDFACKKANFNKATEEISQKIFQNKIDKKIIVIVAVNIFSKDAIGNDIIAEYKILKEHGYNVYLYATGKREEAFSNELFASEGLLKSIINNEENLIIYHHSIYDRGFDRISDQIKSKIIIKYHNITPKEFFIDYNFVSYFACNKGREQLAKLVNHKMLIDIWADSEFNKQEINSMLGDAHRFSVEVIPPFLSENINVQICLQKGDFQKKENSILNVLFVGRMSPNKGHTHLLSVIKSYVDNYNKKIILNLVGGPLNGKYYKKMKRQVAHLKLDEYVFFHENVSDKDIAKFYQDADIFLLMSEHEGFCVPIVEAQINNLPVIALNRGAVGDVIGKNQLIFDEADYGKFSSALHLLRTNSEIKTFLINAGRENLERFRFDVLKNKFVSVVHKLYSESSNV